MQSSMLKSIVEDFGNGGVIDGDLVVEGDLTVSGGGSLSFDEIIEGTQVIDITSTEAFLVRKNGDGGDLFTLDTTNSRMLFAGEMRLNDKDGDGTFGGRIRYDNSDNELRIEANEVSGDDVVIKGNDAIKFEDSGGTKMLLDAGKLTVGSDTSPTGILHIAPGSGSAPTMFFEQHTSATDGTLGEISFGNRAVDGQLALIQAKNDGANDSAFLAFHTEVTSGALTERMRISSDGKVGIGKAPDTLLHLYSTSASKPILKIENEQGGGNPVSIQMLRNTSSPDDDDFIGQIDFRSMNDASTPEEINYAYINSQSTDITDGEEDGEINFFTMKAGTLTRTMTMQSGEVGVNDSDPAKILSVKASGNDDGISLKNSSGQFLALLHQQDSDAGMFRLYDESSTTKIAFNADAGETSYFNNGGVLMVGHTSPTTTGNLTARTQIETTGASAALAITRNTNNANGSYLVLAKTRSGTVGGSTILQEDDEIGTVRFSGADGNDRASHAAEISGQVDGTPGSNDMPGRLVFKTTADGANSATERMRLDSAGQLRIGDATTDTSVDSTTYLKVAKSGTVRMQLNSTNSGVAALHFGDTADVDIGSIEYTNSSNQFDIATNASVAMTIDSSQRVGIGTGSPDKLLTLGQDAIDGGQTAYLKILDTDTDTTADTLLEILFSKYHTGTSAADVASIGGGVEQWSGTSSNRNTYMDFRTVTSGSRTEKMRINSSGQVGIGTGANIDELLHVQNDSNNAVIKIEAGSSSTGARLQLISATNDTGDINFGDSGDTNIGRIKYDHTDNYLAIHTNDTEKMRITSDGQINLTAGIQFPATQVANGGANVLDDYEEGTWTPTYTLATAGDSSFTHDRQIGRYTKVGNVVHIQCFIRTDGYSNSSGSGDLRITGLPFAPDSTTNVVTACSVNSFFFASNNNPINARITNAGSYIALYKRTDVNDDDSTLDENSPSDGSNRNSVIIGGSYRVA